MLRASRKTWWKQDAARGSPVLTPRVESLPGNGNPSFHARRVQRTRSTASTSLEAPTEPGVSAGFAVFQGERFHYFLASKRDVEGVVIEFEMCNEGSAGEIGSTRIPAAGELAFRVKVDDAKCAMAGRRRLLRRPRRAPRKNRGTCRAA